MPVLGKSRVRKRIYVTPDTHASVLTRYRARGYEVVVMSRPVALPIQSNVGQCSTPHNSLSARHCFGEPSDKVVGTKYTLTHDGGQAVGYVNQDYSPPLRNWAARFFGPFLQYFGYTAGVRDAVGVTKSCSAVYCVPSGGSGQLCYSPLIGVLSAGTLSEPYYFLITTLSETPAQYIGKEVTALADVPSQERVTGTVEDYAVVNVWHPRTGPWPLEVLVAAGGPAKPGNSGSPVYPSDAVDGLQVTC